MPSLSKLRCHKPHFLQNRPPSGLQEASGDLQVTSGRLEMASNDVHLLSWAKPVKTKVSLAILLARFKFGLLADLQEASRGLLEASKMKLQ